MSVSLADWLGRAHCGASPSHERLIPPGAPGQHRRPGSPPVAAFATRPGAQGRHQRAGSCAALRPRRGIGRGHRQRHPRQLPRARPAGAPPIPGLPGRQHAAGRGRSSRAPRKVIWQVPTPPPSAACRRRSRARATSSSGGSIGRPAPPPRSWPCAATCWQPATRRSPPSTAISCISCLLVQSRVPRPAPHRLAHAGGHPGEDHRLRGGARDPGLGRPAPAARSGGPALLCLLPPVPDRRAADLRGGGADRRHARQHPIAAARGAEERRAHGQAHHRGVLLDLQLPGGTARHLLRQLPHQAGGRGPDQGAGEPQDLRHALARAGFADWLAQELAGDSSALMAPDEADRLQVLEDPPGSIPPPPRA